MTAQENLKQLFQEIDQVPELLDKENTKIHMEPGFACYLEEEMGINDIKSSGLAGYSVVVGPVQTLYAYNQDKGITRRVKYSYKRRSQ